jgi:hypothetical protein
MPPNLVMVNNPSNQALARNDTGIIRENEPSLRANLCPQVAITAFAAVGA